MNSPKPDYNKIYELERDLGMFPTTDRGKLEQECGSEELSIENKLRKEEVEQGKKTVKSFFDTNGIHEDDLRRMGFELP